jgi:hypothetical protein
MMEHDHFNGDNPEHTVTEEQVAQNEVAPIIGRVNRSIFWPVMLASLLVLCGMGVLVSRGAIAMAATLPVPFTVQASSINATSFKLYPGLSKADNATPVGVNQLDGTLSNLVISKTISLPVIGNVTVSLKAGQNTPVNVSGLTTDVSALTASSATFQNQSVSSSENGNPFEVDATSATLTNADISSPYLFANSITLPGLSLSIS